MQNSLPIVSVNGIIGAQISPLDRGFAYGDGLFETCRVLNGRIPFWGFHKDRLVKSCQNLLIQLNPDLVEKYLADILCSLSDSLALDCIVKIIVTRGEGGRGYRQPNVQTPTIVIGVYPPSNYPPENTTQGVNVRVCNHRLGKNHQLAGLKHLNRLEQVIARAEWNDDAIAEGLLFDVNGCLIEAVFSNVFLIKDMDVFTPDLTEAGVAGVMRRLVVEKLAEKAGFSVHVQKLTLNDLRESNALFLTNSLYGIWPVANVQGESIRLNISHPHIQHLQRLLSETLSSNI